MQGESFVIEGLDELAELMAEPPGGHLNYSEPAADGLGRPIESTGIRAARAYARPRKPFDTIRHGTASAYQNDECRCAEWGMAWAAYKRERRRLNG